MKEHDLRADSVEEPAVTTDNMDQVNDGAGRRGFSRPKLTYIAPQLVKHGSIEKVTAGFFGQFSP